MEKKFKDQPIPIDRVRTRGFTLIEVMIVLAIMAALITLGLSRIKKTDTSAKSVVRKMITMTKEIRNQARLSFSTHRLVIKMDEKEPKFWVESAPGRVSRETEDEKKQRLEDEARGSEDEETSSKLNFSRDARFSKKDIALPPGLYFGLVDIQGQKEPTRQGEEYIYFSPEGFVDQAVIQITDKKKLTWSLFVHPLTGQVDIIPEAKQLKDVKQ